ncbi:hypothetical protein NQ318_011655 [Aromia moschata]|uniref:Reverse transcriptase n=1 Tax=Aromia moschata TaxID=1265417 RepID=A0AAV8Y2A2_9CUCU|nr:hypothetical protein NQ318_011655 [Aromia moschata]
MEIGMMRTECTRKKRTLTRVNGRMTSTEEEKTEARENYKVSKNALNKAIIRAKQEAWDRIVEDVENDIWGQGYKIATKQFRKKNELPDHIIIEEAEKLFPRQVICDWNYEPINPQDIPLFTEEEIRNVANNLKTKRAPGPDCVPPELVKAAVEIATSEYTELMSNLLIQGIFPKMWKEAKLAYTLTGE